MAWNYIDNTLNYLKATLDVIKSSILTAKDILSSIADVMGVIVEMLGFIGFRVFILLITTAFVVWLLNLVSPITTKTNYLIAVGLVLWLAITAKMPIQIVILKYVVIIISPFIITSFVNFFLKNLLKISKILIFKLKIFFNKIFLYFFEKKLNSIKLNDGIGVVFTSDLPTFYDIKTFKEFIVLLGYKVFVKEDEKISLVDDDKRIVFSNDLKILQILNSLNSTDIKLLWFWSSDYKNDINIKNFKKTKLLKQNKYVVGGKENSFILNFLQEKWNWKVIYGYNLKEFIKRYNLKEKKDKNIVESIFTNKNISLSLLNDYNLEDNYFLKEKIIGSDLIVLSDSIGTDNFLNFKNKILFLDAKCESKNIFYRSLNHLKNYMIDNNIYPKSIVFGDILLNDEVSVADVINEFNISIKNNNINMPFFKIKSFDFIKLGGVCIIEYKNNNISINFF